MAVTFRDKHRGPQKLSMSRPRRCRILTQAHPASVSLTSTSWTRPFGQLLGLAVGIRWMTSVSSSLLQIGHCIHIRARASSSWSTSAWPGRLLLAMDLATLLQLQPGRWTALLPRARHPHCHAPSRSKVGGLPLHTREHLHLARLPSHESLACPRARRSGRKSEHRHPPAA